MSAPATALEPPHRALLVEILRIHLPPNTQVRVFGSRANGLARKYSDLDLAIDAGRALTTHERAALAEALSDSDLPWNVDLIDDHLVSERFRSVIAAACVKLDFSYIEPPAPPPDVPFD